MIKLYIYILYKVTNHIQVYYSMIRSIS